MISSLRSAGKSPHCRFRRGVRAPANSRNISTESASRTAGFLRISTIRPGSRPSVSRMTRRIRSNRRRFRNIRRPVSLRSALSVLTTAASSSISAARFSARSNSPAAEPPSSKCGSARSCCRTEASAFRCGPATVIRKAGVSRKAARGSFSSDCVRSAMPSWSAIRAN